MASISISLHKDPPTDNEIRLKVTISGATNTVYLYPKINGNETNNFRTSRGELVGNNNHGINLKSAYNGDLYITFTNCNLSTTTRYSVGMNNGLGGTAYSSNVITYPSSSGGGGSSGGGDGGGSTTPTEYTYGDYDLTHGSWLYGPKYSTSSRLTTSNSYSNYNYLGYVYYDSTSKCITYGNKRQFDGTTTYCTSHDSLNNCVVFFYEYSAPSVQYQYCFYDKTNKVELRNGNHYSTYDSSITCDYFPSGYTYIGFCYNSSFDNAKSQAECDSTSTTCSVHNERYPYIVFCYTKDIDYYYWASYNESSQSYLNSGTQTTSARITAPSYTNYTYRGFRDGYGSYDELVNAKNSLGYTGTYETRTLDINNNKIVFFYTQDITGWQNPYNDGSITLIKNNIITGHMHLYDCKASFITIIIPAHTSVIFETTGENRAPRGGVYNINPSNYGNTTSTDRKYAISLTPLMTDDYYDRVNSHERNCKLGIINDTANTITRYISISDYFYKDETNYEMIPYKITTSSSNYYFITYYNNDGSTKLFTEPYIPDVSKPNNGKTILPTLINNYDFLGWSIEPNDLFTYFREDDILDSTNYCKGDLNLYAVWSFAIWFKADSDCIINTPDQQGHIGYGDNIDRLIHMPTATKPSSWGDNLTTYNINRYNSKDEIIFTNQCIRADTEQRYNLIGWNFKKDGSGSYTFVTTQPYQISDSRFSAEGSGFYDLYALWSTTSFTNTVKQPAIIKITPNDQYIEGYEFLGYTLTKGSNTVDYEVNAEYTIETETDLNLYPVFKKKYYFGKNEEWKNCKLYYGYKNKWVPITIYKGIKGEWK